MGLALISDGEPVENGCDLYRDLKFWTPESLKREDVLTMRNQ